MKLYKDLDKNVKKIKKCINSDDVIFHDIMVKSKKACLIFAGDIVDKNALGQLVLRPLENLKVKITEKTLLSAFYSPEKQIVEEADDIVREIVNGNSVLLVDGIAKAISFGLKKFEKRAIAEPPTSTVIKGPREGFVESLPVNISMMRRKLKTPDLRFENFTVGKFSNTMVSICYLHGVADLSLVDKIRKKLKKIDIDAILDSSYISKFLGEHRRSIFKQVGNTEKPDILAAKILEGRVAIFVDGSPIALTVPYLLIEDFQSPSDYYASSYSATVSRLIRSISVTLSLFLPSFFVASELFHLQFIPFAFLLSIENSIKGIPLSPSSEMFFTLMIFEILNEASVRMPRYVGMVVSIVGGLVLGETAVSAGIISAPTLMIVAFSGICLYTVPELVQTFSVLRLLALLVAGTLGIYGLISLTIIFLTYLVSFESYSTPICAPFSPLITKDLKDSVYKGFFIEHELRPISLTNFNKRRMKTSKKEKK